jgi:hypothetical protein
VESFDKEIVGIPDSQQMTFMNLNTFKRRPIHKLHDISTVTQQTEISHCKSFLHPTTEKKKANVIELLDKSRQQKDAYIKRIMSVSTYNKKPARNSSFKK